MSVALVEPEYGINVGYVARVMANFGLNRLVIVASDGSIDLREAAKFASHGSELVLRARRCHSFRDLRRAFGLLVGTTAIRAKKRANVNRRTVSPEESARLISRNFPAALRSGARGICLVFGRDTTGLTNEELAECDLAVTISTGSAYNTLNVSHAAAIVLYVIGKVLRAQARASSGITDERPGSRAERERVISMMIELARLSDFQHFKLPKLQKTLAGVLARSNPNLRELHLLTGLAGRAASTIRRLSESQAR